MRLKTFLAGAATLLGVTLWTAPAVAGIASIGITGVHSISGGQSGTVTFPDPVDPRITFLLTSPIVLDSAGIDTATAYVTYRVYMANGARQTTNGFTLVDSLYLKFAVDTLGMPPHLLTHDGPMLSIGRILRNAGQGVYSFYVTADDGTGESPASNIVALRAGAASGGFGPGSGSGGQNVAGVEDETGAASLEAWPNPTSGRLHLGSPIQAGTVDVRLFDTRGILVLSLRAESVAGACAVDLSTLSPGAYIAEVGHESRRLRAHVAVAR